MFFLFYEMGDILTGLAPLEMYPFVIWDLNGMAY